MTDSTKSAFRKRLSALLLGVVTTLPVGVSAGSELPAERFAWTGVERVVAVGDLHGHHAEMLSLLEGAELIDDGADWSGGAAHLVLLGDLIDRGPEDRAVLDLARKLQNQAEAAGGRVHVLLGNHEAMNLAGNFEYVSGAAFAAFAADETDAEREEGLRVFRRSVASRGLSASELRAAFDDRYPPGYFAWARALAPDGEYGAWLVEQPAVVHINGRIFTHGGLTEEVAALGLAEINRRTRASLLAFDEQGRLLREVADWPYAYENLMDAARRIVEEGGRRARKAKGGTAEAAWRLLEAAEGLPFATDGPLWYRGGAVENERIEERRVERVLELLDADGLVIAHTPTRSGLVTSRFGGRLYRTDVGMGYGRSGRALVFEAGKIHAFNPSSGSIAEPFVEPPRGQGWPQGEEELPDDVVERFLSRARIRSVSEADFGIPVKLLELEGDGMHLRAVFGYAQESPREAAAEGRSAARRFQHTIASYRIDRMMGLGRVPVTVQRRVRGRRGLVQIWLQGAWDQVLIEQYEAWDLLQGLDTEIAEATAFSALLGVVERVPAGRMFLPREQRVLLADNSVSFPIDGDVDPYLPEGCGPVGPGFLTALRSLERPDLLRRLDGLVSEAAVDALLSRRDGLLARCETADPDWSIERVRLRISNEGG